MEVRSALVGCLWIYLGSHPARTTCSVRSSITTIAFCPRASVFDMIVQVQGPNRIHRRVRFARVGVRHLQPRRSTSERAICSAR